MHENQENSSMSDIKRYKIVYCTPALYMAGGVERVLTLKANYFAEHFGYDITIVLTEGKGRPLFYSLSDKIKVINLDLNFEELWTCSFLKKIFVYLKKQRQYKRLLSKVLLDIRPDITVSLLRREINFVTQIEDGSKKIGELHVNRRNYRNFEIDDSNVIKKIFARFWMKNLLGHLQDLDRFVVLTEEDRLQWGELSQVIAIPDPLTIMPKTVSPLKRKRVIAVGRYVYQKGFDLLLQAWTFVEKELPDWELCVFGQGDRGVYEAIITQLNIDKERCHLFPPTSDILKEYCDSSLFVFSSRFEGFGMVLVEAMACGLPVVSFDCKCGPKDIISHGVDGLLVETGNVQQLASSMSLLMSDANMLSKMGSEARKNVARFNIENIAGRWQKLFAELYDR